MLQGLGDSCAFNMALYSQILDVLVGSGFRAPRFGDDLFARAQVMRQRRITMFPNVFPYANPCPLLT